MKDFEDPVKRAQKTRENRKINLEKKHATETEEERTKRLEDKKKSEEFFKRISSRGAKRQKTPHLDMDHLDSQGEEYEFGINEEFSIEEIPEKKLNIEKNRKKDSNTNEHYSDDRDSDDLKKAEKGFSRSRMG